MLNPHPAKHRTTDRAAARILDELDHATTADKIPMLLLMHSARAADLNHLSSLLGIGDAELKHICAGLVSAGRLVMIAAPAPILVLPSVIEELLDKTISLVSEFHRENVLLRGISREELRKRVYGEFPQEVFRYCLEGLVETGKISLQDETVSLQGHEVQLSDGSRIVRDRIEAIYLSAGFQPPLFSELLQQVQAASDEVKRVYFWMLKEKILVKVAEELAYHRSTLDEIRKAIRSRFSTGDRFGVADFKQMFDLTRKHAIPLLEFLDRERFTRRQGNDRVLL